MSHFSRFIRPGAVRIGFESADSSLMVTAAQNPDGSIAVVLLNRSPEAKNVKLMLADRCAEVLISGQAIQTIVIGL
jgi:glucosylceramidase